MNSLSAASTIAARRSAAFSARLAAALAATGLAARPALGAGAFIAGPDDFGRVSVIALDMTDRSVIVNIVRSLAASRRREGPNGGTFNVSRRAREHGRQLGQRGNQP